MKEKIHIGPESWKEILFQVVLHVLVFSFYIIDFNSPNSEFNFEQYYILFFLNYALANFCISYIFLPLFYYRKKYLAFFFSTILVITLVIIIEEALLEKLFMPESRGANFPGILFTLGQVLPTIIILSGFKFAWDALLKQRKVDKLEQMVRESEQKYLKSQINPHFLFNNLNNLYSYAIEQSPRTPEIILELSAVLRYMLYDCRESSVLLTKEIDHLRSFTELYELQVEQRGGVNFEALDIRQGYRIAPLILIVFIENAFKHSQAGQSEDISIHIKVCLSDKGVLHFSCRNSYLPYHKNDEESGGIGLENVRKRLELIYPESHQLLVENNSNYYSVDLKIQLSRTI
ncbi:sensor histidine kinase [Echinicola sp. 20G]|uniref:sensor histidine kinase n=1 Tax=Echinicola sp. 20G TaxID=2781961 RepID=UPI001910332A|nr:histidine kinase [Echinicola sp. 20G]